MIYRMKWWNIAYWANMHKPAIGLTKLERRLFKSVHMYVRQSWHHFRVANNPADTVRTTTQFCEILFAFSGQGKVCGPIKKGSKSSGILRNCPSIYIFRKFAEFLLWSFTKWCTNFLKPKIFFFTKYWN